MRINIIAGQTPCPYYYTYDGSLGDDPNPRIELKNSDGSYDYDDNVLIERTADGARYKITGIPDGNGKFLYSYRFTLVADLLSSVMQSFTFPLTLPYTFQ